MFVFFGDAGFLEADGIFVGDWIDDVSFEVAFFYGFLVPEFREFFDFFWVLAGEVVEFCAVFGDVIKLPARHAVCDEFPIALNDRAVGGKAEKERTMWRALFPLKNGNER